MNITKMKPEPKRRTTDKTSDSPDFAEMVKLLAVFSEAASRLAEIEAEANSALLQLIDEHKAEYAKLQEAQKAAETALEAIARTHPEWFSAARSIKTPYGKVSFRTGTSLRVENDEATVKLIYAEEARINAQGTPFIAEDYIRVQEVPNIEALEKLDDALLARFMVKRVSADSFSVTPAKVDFGKAVKEAAAQN